LVGLGILAAGLWLGAVGGSALDAAPSPQSYVKLSGVEYLAGADYGARFGLKATLTDSGRKLTLKSAWTTIELGMDSRDCAINGLRVFLGDPIRSHQGTLHLSRLDAEKLLTPILLAGADEPAVPALRTIVIDPGHGGRDPGKENNRLRVNEKTLALDTALRLKKVLETAGYRVVMTRSADENLGPDKASDLLRRAEIAQQANADLFVSLHYNAVGSGAQRVTGVEVYSLTPQFQFSTSDPEHEDDQGAGEANRGNAYDHWNTVVGYQVHRRMIENLRASDRGLKRARWAVLRHAPCPAILIESGFLSNDTEARRITTAAYRQKIAVAIADGIQAYGNILAGARKQRAGK